jgi:predicted N-formylglutamate amidohydrolase
VPGDKVAVLITCEHGGNSIPARYRDLFRGSRRTLASHRGWDPGALVLAKDLRKGLRAPLIAATVSRLVVDLNRSPDSPTLLSRWTAQLPEAGRGLLLREHYRPYRRRVEETVERLVGRGRTVVHISVHTFTPVMRGVRREVDVGLLFDPARTREAALCRDWRRLLVGEPLHALARFNVRHNQPYRGTDDGLTTSLRSRFPASRYLGIELEVNQRFPRRGGRLWSRVRQRIVGSTYRAVSDLGALS